MPLACGQVSIFEIAARERMSFAGLTLFGCSRHFLPVRDSRRLVKLPLRLAVADCSDRPCSKSRP
jgi:hypothetical protein